MKFKDYYQILGVSPTATAAEIKAAYRKLARQLHPDRNKAANAEERFKEVNEANEALSDPERRKQYDQLRAQGFRPGDEMPPPGGGAQDFDLGDILRRAGASGRGAPAGGGAGAGGPQFSDFFESMFGGARRGPGSAAGPGASRATPEQRAVIDVDLDLALTGGKQRVLVPGPDGSRTLEISIPKGIRTGKVIRLAGQGNPGDLLLEVKLRDASGYELKGDDLYLRLPVTPWEAVLGAKVKAHTPDGEIELKLPAGSNSGRKLRLKGRGFPVDGSRGDLYVVLEIHAPQVHGPEDEALYRQLAEHFGHYNPRG
jgi:curved DNA-binding protein